MEVEDKFHLSARQPLKYALAAQELPDHHDQFEEHREWVLFWVAGVALLRAVGHVLAKVDAARCPELKRIISVRWAAWNSDRETNAIFWDFIEKERNNVLKVFELGVEGIDQMPLAYETMTPAGEQIEHLYHTDYLLHGETGEDGRDIFDEAVKWWESELAAIEMEWRSSTQASAKPSA